MNSVGSPLQNSGSLLTWLWRFSCSLEIILHLTQQIASDLCVPRNAGTIWTCASILQILQQASQAAAPCGSMLYALYFPSGYAPSFVHVRLSVFLWTVFVVSAWNCAVLVLSNFPSSTFGTSDNVTGAVMSNGGGLGAEFAIWGHCLPSYLSKKCGTHSRERMAMIWARNLPELGRPSFSLHHSMSMEN